MTINNSFRSQSSPVAVACSRLQPQPMHGHSADERRLGHVHIEPREWQLMHADVQQRVHGVGQQIMLGRHIKQHVCLQRQRMRRIGGADERAYGPVHGEPGERELVHADVQQRVHCVWHEDVCCGHAHDRHGHVQPQRMCCDRSVGGFSGHVPVESGKWLIVHADVQHGV